MHAVRNKVVLTEISPVHLHCLFPAVFFKIPWIAINNLLELWDHVYFVHPSTDISVEISTDIAVECRSMHDRYVGRRVDRHSADISIEMCRSTY